MESSTLHPADDTMMRAEKKVMHGRWPMAKVGETLRKIPGSYTLKPPSEGQVFFQIPELVMK